VENELFTNISIYNHTTKSKLRNRLNWWEL